MGTKWWLIKYFDVVGNGAYFQVFLINLMISLQYIAYNLLNFYLNCLKVNLMTYYKKIDFIDFEKLSIKIWLIDFQLIFIGWIFKLWEMLRKLKNIKVVKV